MSFKMSKQKIVSIIGGAGFIGSQVFKGLKNNSIDCEVVSRQDCNLLCLEEVEEFFLPYKNKNLDIIFAASIVRRNEDTKSSSKDNILMVSNFIKSISDYHINSFIYISSIDVYLNNGIELNESSLLSPKNPYSISKLNSETMLKKVFKDNLTILRLPGVYGKDDICGSIIGKFTNLIKNNEYLKLVNNGNQLRDYLYVEDITRAILRLLERPSFGVFNLSSGKSMPLVEIIRIISDALCQNSSIEKSIGDLKELDLRISNKKFLKEYPGFTFTPMEEGIQKYINELN